MTRAEAKRFVCRVIAMTLEDADAWDAFGADRGDNNTVFIDEDGDETPARMKVMNAVAELKYELRRRGGL